MGRHIINYFQDTDFKEANLQTRSDSIPNTKSLKVWIFVAKYEKLKCSQDLGRHERKRIISKSGDCNTQLYRVSDKNKRLMQVWRTFHRLPETLKSFKQCCRMYLLQWWTCSGGMSSWHLSPALLCPGLGLVLSGGL